MSQFTDFFNQNNNKFIEVVDATNAHQCFDLVVAWTDFLKIPRSFPFNYAYQIYTSYGPTQAQYFDRISNGPNDIPREGDIIVWNYLYNYGAGHTGIAMPGAGLYNFNCLEQNDPTGSNSHVRNYSYSNILGWLRPKSVSTTVPLTDTQKVNAITKEWQSGNSPDDKLKHIGQILGLVS